MQKLYSRINWENKPSIDTPLNAPNMNKMDAFNDNIDNRVIAMDALKADRTELSNLVESWVMDEETGIITITKVSGEKILFDLNIEKIPVGFSLSDDGILTMTTDDGTEFTANIGAMIPVLTFADSDEIAVSVSGSGVNKTYSFSIKTGSVTEDKLDPNFLADINVSVAKAEAFADDSKEASNDSADSAILSKSWAVGGTETRDGEDTDNSKYYSEQSKADADRAKREADRASDIVGIGIATTEKAGIVKPDGETTTVDEDGTLHAFGAGTDLSAASLPYNGPSDTETTKEVIDALKTEVSEKADESQLNDNGYTRVLSCAELRALESVEGEIVIKDTESNVNTAITDGIIPNGTLAIITDDSGGG